MIEPGAENAFAHGPQAYHVKVRVEFDDGETAEISGKIGGGLEKYDVGAVLPIRYDQNDRSKIAIDEPALEAIADETRTKAREIKQERADRQIAVGTKSGVGIGTATSSANRAQNRARQASRFRSAFRRRLRSRDELDQRGNEKH